MRKVYDIKISDLKLILNTLNLYANDSVVTSDIHCLGSYISRLENQFLDQDISLYEKLLDDAGDLHFYKPFYPIFHKFAELGRCQDELSFKNVYTPFYMSDEQAMNDAKEFFQLQDEFFYSQFEEFNDEANNHLKFVDKDADTDGETLMLKSTGDAFVFVPNHSNITKFTILIHELEHCIDFFNNPNFLDDYVIRETSAVFFELLASDFIASKYNLFNDGFQRRSYLHTLIKSQAAILMDKYRLLDLINDKKDLNEQELFAYLVMNNFDIDDIYFLSEATLMQDNSYQIPYLIAVELYVLYYKNKELALIILQDIILNATQYNILDILSKYGIVLNTNVVQYENDLYKKITL